MAKFTLTEAVLFIDETCRNLEKRISDRGFVNPEVSMKQNWIGRSCWLTVSYQVSQYGNCHSDTFKFDRTDEVTSVEELFFSAERYIDELKTPDDVKRDDFRRDLGRLIDDAKVIGFDLDQGTDAIVLKMLEDAMKSLSENIITHQED